jgi:Fe-S cluster biogenesis protein NfuA
MSPPTDSTSLTERIRRIIIEEVLPILHMDGGGVEVLAVQEGVVQVRLLGSCGGCPSTVHTVLLLLEDELRRRVPEIEYLEAVP